MSKAPSADPNPLQVAAGGGTVKFRLKNPDTKGFLYHIEIADPANWQIAMPPFGTLPMGDGKFVEVTKKAGPACESKVSFKFYKEVKSGQDFDLDALLKSPPLHQFELKLIAK
ncbi:unnamed protein product, partial [Mesorhabditis spiculigera]